MAYDQHANLAYATVAVAPSPAASGTSLTVAAGKGSLFPTAPFNCTVYPSGTPPLASNAEIVRVTNVVGDVFTIVRSQEGTTAKNIATGWQIANTATKLVFTDIENSIIQFISAGSTKAGASEVVFSNANGVTFGVDGQTVTASVHASNAGGVALSAGTQSQATGTVSFADGNNVSFGLDNGTLTGSAMGVWIQAGTSARSTGGVIFSDANSVSFGMDNLGVITASINPPAGGVGIAISGGTSSQSTGTVVFSNSNGVSFGLDNGTMTASIPAGAAPGTISAGANSVALGQVVFSNSNNVTFGLNGSTVTASASNAAQSTQPVAASASNGSFLFSTLAFSNANNVTFGTSAGSIVTASVAAPGGGGSINFSAGTQSADLASIVFSNSNGVTFGLSNGTITASASGGSNANATVSYFRNINFNANLQTFVTQGPGTIRIAYLAPQCAIKFNKAHLIAAWTGSIAREAHSSTTTGQHEIMQSFAIYKRSITDSADASFSNSSVWVVALSGTASTIGKYTAQSQSFSYNFSWVTDSNGGANSFSSTSTANTLNIANISGTRNIVFPIETILPAGDYFAAFAFSSSTAGQSWASSMMRFNMLLITGNTNGLSATLFTNFAASGNESFFYQSYAGVYSVSSANFPASIVSGDLIGNQAQFYIQFDA